MNKLDLQKKIFLPMASVSTIGTAIIVILVLSLVIHFQELANDGYIKAVTNETATNVENLLNSEKFLIDNSKEYIEKIVFEEENKSLIRRELESNLETSDTSLGRFVVIGNKEDNNYVYITKDGESEPQDTTGETINSEYCKSVMETGNTMFFKSSDAAYIIAPLNRNEEVIGVTGSVIDVDLINSILNKNKLFETGYFSLVKSNGFVMYSTIKDEVSKNYAETILGDSKDLISNNFKENKEFKENITKNDKKIISTNVPINIKGVCELNVVSTILKSENDAAGRKIIPIYIAIYLVAATWFAYTSYFP